MAVAVAAKRARARRVTSAQDPEVGLMLRVQEGDDEAFRSLVEHYWSRVFGRLYRQLGDRQEAEDLTQDVFLRLHRSRTRYKPKARFATWLYHITRNVARNALRSRRRRPCVRLSALAASEGERFEEQLLSDRAEPPSTPIERAEVTGAVRTAVSGLAGRQRTAVELHQFHDCTYAEVAAELDMSPKAAKSLLYRARIQLRAALTVLLEP